MLVVAWPECGPSIEHTWVVSILVCSVLFYTPAYSDIIFFHWVMWGMKQRTDV